MDAEAGALVSTARARLTPVWVLRLQLENTAQTLFRQHSPTEKRAQLSGYAFKTAVRDRATIARRPA